MARRGINARLEDFMGRIVWFGLVAAGAPAEGVILGVGLALVGTYYLGKWMAKPSPEATT